MRAGPLHTTTLLRAAIAIAAAAILMGPQYTEVGYDWRIHSVSELAGQATRNAWVMRTGLIALGVGVTAGFFDRRSLVDAPFLVFGLAMIGVGLAPHRPFVAERAYSETLDAAHSVFASLAGLAAVAGFVARGVAVKRARRLVYFALAGAYTILPLMMWLDPGAEGVYQRVTFGSFLVWAWFDYPADPSIRLTDPPT